MSWEFSESYSLERCIWTIWRKVWLLMEWTEFKRIQVQPKWFLCSSRDRILQKSQPTQLENFTPRTGRRRLLENLWWVQGMGAAECQGRAEAPKSPKTFQKAVPRGPFPSFSPHFFHQIMFFLSSGQRLLRSAKFVGAVHIKALRRMWSAIATAQWCTRAFRTSSLSCQVYETALRVLRVVGYGPMAYKSRSFWFWRPFSWQVWSQDEGTPSTLDATTAPRYRPVIFTNGQRQRFPAPTKFIKAPQAGGVSWMGCGPTPPPNRWNQSPLLCVFGEFDQANRDFRISASKVIS